MTEHRNLVRLLLALGLALAGCAKYETIARLDAGGGTEFIVSAANAWDNSRPFYYQVRHNGATVVPLTFLIGAGDHFGGAFEVRSTADHSLVAVVESSAPDIVLALFDTASGQTWPRAGDTEQFTAVRARGLSLLSRLQQSYPDQKLVLSEDVPGSRTANP